MRCATFDLCLLCHACHACGLWCFFWQGGDDIIAGVSSERLACEGVVACVPWHQACHSWLSGRDVQDESAFAADDDCFRDGL